MRKRRILAAYGVLLLASHGVRCSRSTAVELRADESASQLLEVEGDDLNERRVRVVWSEAKAGHGQGEGLPVLLLHGSPGRKSDLRAVSAGLVKSIQQTDGVLETRRVKKLNDLLTAKKHSRPLDVTGGRRPVGNLAEADVPSQRPQE